MRIISAISSVIASIGAINWGLVGIWDFDAVAWIAGGSQTVAAKIIYIVVGVCGVVALVCALAGCCEAKE